MVSKKSRTLSITSYEDEEPEGYLSMRFPFEWNIYQKKTLDEYPLCPYNSRASQSDGEYDEEGDS